MNTNAQALYDDLKEGRLEHFDMKDYFNACGTPSCIGGHIAHRMGLKAADLLLEDAPGPRVMLEWLGLNRFYTGLFLPARSEHAAGYTMYQIWGHMYKARRDPFTATQAEAAEALRRACELFETQG